MTNNSIGSSFRDPSGFIFKFNGILYRQINTCYAEEFEYFIRNGLYTYLLENELIIPHEEVADIPFQTADGYKIIKPVPLSFISYPYEWCFDQLKDAALVVLQIQLVALTYGMCLKDASAYNIQFWQGKAVLIDTLSFERYIPGEPWIAYRQFCQHFLAPLLLIHYTDIRLSQLLKSFLDGIPLDLASKLLPFKSYFSFPVLTHLHLHAKWQIRHADSRAKQKGHLTLHNFKALLENLVKAVANLQIKKQETAWAAYYFSTNYTSKAESHKEQLINSFLEKVNPASVWDLGGNTGRYSQLASQKNIQTISIDIDEIAVNINYTQVKSSGEKHLLPLVIDLSNPSSSIGWANQERESLAQRGPAELVMVLAFLHHLAIGQNIPFNKIADFLHKLARWVIIEFIPKSDSQVQRLLTNRKDIFTHYTETAFEESLKEYFVVKEKVKITDADRILYLLKSLGS